MPVSVRESTVAGPGASPTGAAAKVTTGFPGNVLRARLGRGARFTDGSRLQALRAMGLMRVGRPRPADRGPRFLWRYSVLVVSMPISAPNERNGPYAIATRLAARPRVISRYRATGTAESEP